MQRKNDQVSNTRQDAASNRGPEEDMVTGITQCIVTCEVEMGQKPVSTQSRDEKQTKTQGQQFLTD